MVSLSHKKRPCITNEGVIQIPNVNEKYLLQFLGFLTHIYSRDILSEI